MNYMILSMGSGVRGSVRGPFFTRHRTRIQPTNQPLSTSGNFDRYNMTDVNRNNSVIIFQSYTLRRRLFKLLELDFAARGPKYLMV